MTAPANQAMNLRALPLPAGGHGDDYTLHLSIPEGDMPATGWPLLLLLEAQMCMATAVETMQRMARRSDATGVRAMAVAGLAARDPANTQARRRDFATPGGGEGQRQANGQAPAFLDFLERTVLPQLDEAAPLDVTRRTLFGHSLAGYFTLWSLAQRPALFHRHVALSPSIWWDREALFAGIDRIAELGPQAFLAAGEWEGELPPWQAGLPGSEGALERRKSRRMAANARDLAERIARHPRARAEFHLYPDEDHASIVTAAMPRALRFAARP